MNWELNLGSLLIVASVIFSAGGFYAATRSQVAQAKKDNDALKEDISDIKTDLKTLNKVVMDVALQNQRLDNQAERITQIEKRSDARLLALETRWDEVRRGEGLIVDRSRS